MIPNTTTPKAGIVRFILFKWDDDTAPTIADLLDNTRVESCLALNKRKKWIIFDKWWVMHDIIDDRFGQRIYAWYKKLKIECNFDGAATTTGQTGRLFMIIFSDIAANASADVPLLHFHIRVRFKDP